MALTSSAPAATAPPFSHPADFYQTRDFGQKWEATARLLRLHGQELLGAQLRYVTLWMVVGAFFQAVGIHYVGTDGAMLNPLGLMFEIVGSFVSTGIVYGFLRARMHALDEPNARFTPSQVWDFVNGLGAYFGSSLIGGAMLALGLICLVLPGLYVMVALTLLPAVVLLEDGEKTLSRCFDLLRGNFWTTAGLFLITVLMNWAVVKVPSSLLQALALLMEMNFTDWAWVLPTQLLESSLKFVLQPILSILLAFNYFSIVETKESPGLQRRATRNGYAEPAAPPAPDTLYGPDADQLL